MRKIIITGMLTMSINILLAQTKLQPELFVRTIHLVNQNLTTETSYYSPNLSAGFTLRYGSAFSDFGWFINKDDFSGYYTFFGSVLKSSKLDDNWLFVNTWFGECAVILDRTQEQEPYNIWIYTIGVNNALVKPLGWGTIAIPLTIGVGYSDETYSLNFRAVLNLSIPINNKKLQYE